MLWFGYNRESLVSHVH